MREDRAAREFSICDWSVAIGLCPNDPIPLRGRAVAWQGRKTPEREVSDLSRGADDYLRIAELDQKPSNRYDAGLALYEAERDEEALRIIDDLIQSDPESPEYWSAARWRL